MGGIDPDTKEPAVMVGFRCTTANEAWLRSYVKQGRTLSRVADWAVTMGRECVGALGDQGDRIIKIASEEGVSRGVVLAKIFSLGLAAYERERKQKK